MLATAITRYPQAPELDRPELVDDVQRIDDLLCGLFGYERMPGLPLNPTAAQLHDGLFDFAVTCLPDDYVVVYLTGHGEILDSGEHILLPSDIDPNFLRRRMVKTGDVAEWMLRDTPLRRLMVILDTCYAGQGGMDFAREALSGWTGHGGLVVIAATRPSQQAQPGVFTQALARAADNEATAAFAAPVLMPDSLMTKIKSDALVPATQSAIWVQLGGGEDLHFLKNPRHRPDLVELDIDAQAQILAQRSTELDARFTPATAWFTGRYRVLTDLAAWLTARGDADGRARVVTGTPGSGKTAVLGLLAALSDPERRGSVPRDGLPAELAPGRALDPVGTLDAAIYAGTLPTEAVLAGIGAAAGLRLGPDGGTWIGRLLTVLEQRSRPLVVLIDALDEAADPQSLVRLVLRPLIDHGGSHLRLLLGTRTPLLHLLGHNTVVLNLDDGIYADPAAVASYIRRVLLTSGHASPYRSASDRTLDAVTSAVAKAAGPSFLVARIISPSLSTAPTVAEASDHRWRETLPRDAEAAMWADLESRLGAGGASRARALLLPLAYAQGAGMPWEDMWPALAAALAPGSRYSDEDIRWLRSEAGGYIKEGVEADRSTYRLFHQALSEHLRGGRDEAADHAAIAETLVQRVPAGPSDRRDWSSAHPYIRTHLATHAARGGRFDPLLDDPDYLLSAAQPQVHAALPSVTSEQAKRHAHAYRRAAHELATKPRAEWASYLELAARCYGAPGLAERINAGHPRRPWSTRWASWRPANAPLYSVTGHTGSVRAVAVAKLNGRPVLVSGGTDCVVRVHDLETGTPIGQGFSDDSEVRAVAVAELHGRPVVITNGRVWDLETGVPLGPPLTGDTGPARAVAVSQLSGRPVVVSCEDDHVRVWDLETRDPVAVVRPLTRGDSILAVAVGQVNGRPVVVSGGWDPLRVWDLETGSAVGQPIANAGSVYALAVAELHGRPVVVAGVDATVRIWDMETGAPLGWPLVGPAEFVTTVAVAHVRGRPVVVSGSGDRMVHIWDLETGAPVCQPLTGHNGSVNTVAVALLLGRPVVVSGGKDHRVFVWDLDVGAPTGQPFTGHLSYVNAVAAAQVRNRWTVMSGSDDHTVRVWDLETGAPVGLPFTGHSGSVNAVAVAELHGRPVVVSGGDDHTVRVWDLETDVPPREPFTGHTAYVAALAAGELRGRSVVVSGGGDGTVRVWDLETGAPVGQPFTGHSGSVNAVAVAELHGRPVVVSGGDDGTVRVWDLETGVPVGRPYTGHTYGVGAVAVAKLNGRPVVVSGSDDCTILVWELETGSSAGSSFTGATGSVRALAVAMLDGRPVVVCATGDNTFDGAAYPAEWARIVRIRDLETATAVGQPFTGHSSWVSTVAVAELHGRPVVISGGDDRTVRVWDLATGGPAGQPFAGHTASVSSVVLAELHNRPVVVSGGIDQSVRIWDLETGAQAGQQPITLHTGLVRAMAVATLHGRSLVVSGGDDNSLRVWDLETGARVGRPLTGHTDSVSTLAVAELHGRPVVVSGSIDHSLRVWDLETGVPVGQPFVGHTSSVSAMAVAKLSGRLVLLSGTADGSVWCWDLGTGRVVQRRRPLDGTVSAVAISSSDARQPMALAGTSSGILVAWSMGPAISSGRRTTLRRPRRVGSAVVGRYSEPINALGHLDHPERILVGSGSTLFVRTSADQRMIDIDAPIRAFATVGPHCVVVATDQGIAVVEVHS
jgi:WD40 repeat protein